MRIMLRSGYEYEIESGSSGKFKRTNSVGSDCDAGNTFTTGTLTGATKVKYDSDEVCVIANETYLADNTLDEQEILYFAATQVSNWLVSSKMDMQKLALTGGKFKEFDPDGTLGNSDDYIALIPESRNCDEQKMIKEVTLDKNGSPTNPITRLTLAVRSDD